MHNEKRRIERRDSLGRETIPTHLSRGYRSRDRSGEPRYLPHMNMDLRAPSKQATEMVIDELYDPDSEAKPP